MVSAAVADFVAAVGPLLPIATPSAAAAANALNRVRMCATRACGASSPTGTAVDWQGQLASALMNLELAVATAITDQPGMTD